MARTRNAGWRSARWYGEPATAGGPGTAAPPFHGPSGPGNGTAPHASTLATGEFDELSLMAKWPWQGVQWGFAYVSFLAYVFVVTSYTIPIGTATMVAAILGVFMVERPRLTPPALMYVVFFLIATLAYLGSDWKGYTLEFWTGLAKVLLVFFVAQIVLNSRERVRFFLFFYLGVYALFPVRGALFNYFLYHSTTAGRVGWNNIFENPNDISALILFPFAIAIGFIFVERNKLLRLCAQAALICIPLVLALAQSRGALLALMGGGGLFFLRNKRARATMLAGAAVVLVVFVTLAPSSMWKRMMSLESAASAGDLQAADDEGSAEQRFEIWKVAVVVIEEHPVLGVGPGSYPFAHVFAARNPEILRMAGGLRDAHSTYFTLMAEYGVFGFIFYMGAAVLCWAKSREVRTRIETKLPRQAQQLLIAEIGLISFGASAVFGTFIPMIFTYIQLAIVWAMAESAEKTAVELGVIRAAKGAAA